jgi:hypothetical protein
MQYGPATRLDTLALRHDVTGYVLEKVTWCDEAVIVERDTMEQYSGQEYFVWNKCGYLLYSSQRDSSARRHLVRLSSTWDIRIITLE